MPRAACFNEDRFMTALWLLELCIIYSHHTADPGDPCSNYSVTQAENNKGDCN